jgi:hypothetical protein
MKIMIIDKANGWIRIKVDELPEQRYLWYSEREAIRKYREKYNLTGKHIRRFYM